MKLANIQTDEFYKLFQNWQHRLNKCIKLQGGYVGGVKNQIYDIYNEIPVIFGSPTPNPQHIFDLRVF